MQVAEHWMTNPSNVGLSVDAMGTLVWSTHIPHLVVLAEPQGGFSLAQVKEDLNLYDTPEWRACLKERELIRMFDPDGSGVVERWKFAIAPQALISIYLWYRGTTIPHDMLTIGHPVIHTGNIRAFDKLIPNWHVGHQPMGRLRSR